MTRTDDELRAALRAEAAAHRPDREAMLDRVTRAAVRGHAPQRRPASRLRAGAVAVAVAAVLGGGGVTQWALAGDGRPQPQPGPLPSAGVPAVPVPATTTPAVTPSRSVPPSATAARPARPQRPSRPASPPPSAGHTSPTGPGADRTAAGPLWSDGSVDRGGDKQGSGVVTVRTTERLTALEVTVRVARTPGLVSRGGSRQVPGASVTSAVTAEADALTYRFVLSSGDVLEPGTYVFYARYRWTGGGRDAGGDTYRAVATTAGGTGVTVSGDFA